MDKNQGTPPEGLEILYKLNFQPEFVRQAKANLFLLALEEHEKFTFKVDGQDVSLNLPHFEGANMQGLRGRVFIPLSYIPMLHKIPEALITVGRDDPLRQNTILHKAVQELSKNCQGYLQEFLDVFDVHPAIQMAEEFAKMFAEMFGVDPPKPYRGNDHVARSKLYNNVVAIDGEIYAEFCKLDLSAALEVFVRACDKVQRYEAQIKGITDESLSGKFALPSTPSDLQFWKNLFTTSDKDREYSVKPDLLPGGGKPFTAREDKPENDGV